MALHLVHGIAIASLRFPYWSQPQRHARVQIWSAHLLHILAIRLDVSGTPVQGATPAMLVANHVSWLDVYALNAICPAQFVAKTEIGSWPLLGLFARKSGTVFIDRTRRRDILRVNAQLATLMRKGTKIAVFPEGTTTEGNSILPFRPPLLQSAIACDARLQAVAIRYERTDGSPCREASFVGDTTFAAALWLVLTQPVIHARLHFLPAVTCSGKHRKVLAREAERSIARALNLYPVNFPVRRAPETALKPLMGAAFQPTANM